MTWRVKARRMWVARVVTPTTHSLLVVAALTEAGAVTAQAGSGIGARLHAVSTEEIAAMKETRITVRSHPDSIYAGAIGAALWGAYRHEKLKSAGSLHRAA